MCRLVFVICMLFALPVAAAEPCSFNSDASFPAFKGECPAGLQDMINREQACRRFYFGEVDFEKRNAPFVLAEQIKRFRCTALPADKTALVESYIVAKRDDVLSALTAYEEFARKEVREDITMEEVELKAPVIPDARTIIEKHKQ